jgi:hypothetical protein
MNPTALPGAHLFADRTRESPGLLQRTGHVQGREFDKVFAAAASELQRGSGDSKQGLVRLGTITRDNPTVSHLLMQHAEYREQCWDIVHDPVNGDKPFRDLSLGEPIWLDPQSKEILVGDEARGAPAEASRSRPFPAADTATLFRPEPMDARAKADFPSQSLSRAVTGYVGTPYERLDCYELVVQGLKDLGLDYSGEEGLQTRLMHKARLDTGDPNAYLTGEGLINSLGTQVYRQHIPPDSPERHTAGDLMHSLGQRLEPGMILSLSTPEGGHTGVISRRDGEWTFVNSGRIQHAVDGVEVRRGVAEEKLHSELAQWLQKARERGQDLSISVGRLTPGKMSRFLEPSGTLSASI